MRALVALLFVTLPLAGCLGGDGDAPVETASSEVGGGANALAGNATENATATSPEDLTGGHAPHIHDYWGESDRVTLFHDEVRVSVLSSATFVNLLLRKEPALGGRFWELPEGATVYEGTGKLELTASWTDATITGLAASWKAPNEKWDASAFSEFQPLTNGQAFVIDVTPEMTDMPHEAVSRWGFFFTAAGTPAVAEGAVDLKVDVVRMRDVLEFPGHPDTYEDTDRYVLADKDFAYRNPSIVTEISDVLVTGDTKREPVTLDAPVPMETEVLIVEIKVSASSVTAPIVQKNGLYLAYRTASGDGDYVAPLNSTEDTFVFGVPVTVRDVDSPYTTVSQWEFHPIVRETVDTPLGGGSMCSGCLDQEIQGHITVTAYDDDPTGKVGAADDED